MSWRGRSQQGTPERGPHAALRALRSAARSGNACARVAAAGAAGVA